MTYPFEFDYYFRHAIVHLKDVLYPLPMYLPPDAGEMLYKIDLAIAEICTLEDTGCLDAFRA